MQQNFKTWQKKEIGILLKRKENRMKIKEIFGSFVFFIIGVYYTYEYLPKFNEDYFSYVERLNKI